jgi:hypothetical protein
MAGCEVVGLKKTGRAREGLTSPLSTATYRLCSRQRIGNLGARDG